MEIITKKTLLSDKNIIEDKHLEEIKQYIKELELAKEQLELRNKEIEIKYNASEEELEKERDENTDLYIDNEQIKDSFKQLWEKNSHIVEVFPEAKEYNQAYDLLSDYKEKVNSRISFSETYHMGTHDVAIIANYGYDVASSFVDKSKTCLIPLNREDIEANLYFIPNSYEKNDGGTINVYTDYNIGVAVTNKEELNDKEYSLSTFEKEFKDDIPHLNKKDEKVSLLSDNNQKRNQLQVSTFQIER